MNHMTHAEQKAILTIALLAAFADGVKDDAEREELRRIAEALADQADSPDLAYLYQDVLLKRVTLESAGTALVDRDRRQLAYEMALCVCEADGHLADAERHFLDALKRALGLDAAQAGVIEGKIDHLREVNKTTIPPIGGAAMLQTQVSDADMDRSILNYAVLNGALELLPQSWASMAIIPLQIKMVYGIGKAHGVALDQGHVKEFIAAAGVGLTSQYLEQIGRKLLGGLLGKAAGKTFGKLGSAASGMAISFATTYALGQVAKRYYAGGRVMNSAMLRDTFQTLLGSARQLQTGYLPQIREKAASLDAGQVMAMIREQPGIRA